MSITALQPALAVVRILGIDPGSQRTGIGIIDVDPAGRSRHVFHTALNLLDGDDDAFAARLKRIFDGIGAIVAEYAPHEVAIERVFVAHNADSALKLGQARGAAICAVMELAFNAPARLDDLLSATVAIEDLRSASFSVRQQLLREPEPKALVEAKVRIACLDAQRFRPRPIPNHLLQEIAPA